MTEESGFDRRAVRRPAGRFRRLAKARKVCYDATIYQGRGQTI